MTRTLILANFFTDWWNSIGFAKQIFYGIALLAAAMVIIMAVVSMFGIGEDVELDADAADAGGSLLSIKPIIGFLFAFGWAGGAALSAGLTLLIATILAIAAGAVVMFGIAAILRASQRLKVDGTLKKENSIGKVATVYVTIPPANQGGGQVIIPLDGRTITLGALQNGDTPLPSGSKVKVTALIDPSTVRIEPL